MQCKLHPKKPAFGCRECILVRGTLYSHTSTDKIRSLKYHINELDTTNEKDIDDFLDEIERFLDELGK